MQIKAYKNLSITTPECHPGTPIWCADFQLDRDVSPLFPYINAVVKGALLHKKFQPPVPILEIFKLLPRTNCKKCGVPTCMAFAAALSKREAELNHCRDFQDDNDENFLKLESLFPISHGTG